MVDHGQADSSETNPANTPPNAGGGNVPEKPAEFDPWKTRPSIFGRILSEENAPREIAWREFYARYVPLIRSFAASMGVNASEVEDVVQEVLIGFFSVGSSFVYDPAKGRFRGYLKRATVNAIRSRARKTKLPMVAIEGIDAEKPGSAIADIEAAWNTQWELQMLNRAMERLHLIYKDSKTVQAFELYVVKGVAASDVAEKLNISRESVYQAKIRITELLKTTVAQLEAEEP